MKRSAWLVVSAALFAGVALAKEEPVRVFEPKFREPQVAVAPSGRVFVVAGDGESLHVATSKDGKAFEKPVLVGRAKTALGMRRGPRIAATAESVVVTAVAVEGDKKGDVLSWRSGDEGATWEGPLAVNHSAGSGREGLHGMAAGPNDEIACAWLDLRNK